MTWTDNQMQVLNSNGATLVSASAGTGKTAVLTEKVARTLVNDLIPVQNLLVVTFSNAAAQEMKERIKGRLFELAKDSSQPRNIRNRARYCLNQFSQANIQTIHSFCYDVIKAHAMSFGFNSSVSVADDIEAIALKATAIKAVLEKEYNIKDKSFLEVERYIAQSGKTMESAIVKLTDTIRGFENPQEWMDKALTSYEPGDGSEIPVQIYTLVMNVCSEVMGALEEALKLVQMCKGDYDKPLSVIRCDIDIVAGIMDAVLMDDVDYLVPDLFRPFGATLRFPKKVADEDQDRIIKASALRDDAKKKMHKFFNKGNFSMSEHLQRIREMKPMVEKLFCICREFMDAYKAVKVRRNVIDFADMERMAYELLQDNAVSNTYRAKYSKVFIDEYQDTSPIQEKIISRITSNENLFCVGDLKQSIYRFRSSDPTLFNARSKSYQNGQGNVISLSDNFRSSLNVLNCANDVFYNIVEGSEEMSYTSDDELTKGSDRIDSDAPTVVNIIPSKIKEEYPDCDANQIEVLNIIKNVKSLVGQPIYDKKIKAMRPAEYRDIAVLTRNLAGVTASINDLFTANSIPFTIDKTGSLLDTFEIKFLMDILHLCCNLRDDLRLVTAIHSGLFYLDDEDLINIRKYNPNASIYDNMLSLAKEDLTLGTKCSEFFEMFSNFSRVQDKTDLVGTIRYIIDDLDYMDVAVLQRNGMQAKANISAFLRLAEQYQHKCFEKIHRFLDALENLQDYDVVLPEARTLEGSRGVNITTIHKSKGLEYPIVIIAFAGKEFSGHKNDDIFLCDKDEGFGVKYFSYNLEEKGICLNWKYIEDVMSFKNKEEEMRLLYVAMTRAQDRLVIQTTERNYHDLKNSCSYADYVLNSIVEKGEIKDNLRGNWKIQFTEPEDLKPLLGNVAELTSEEFLKEYFFNASVILEDPEPKPIILPTPMTLASSKLDDSLTLSIPNFKIPSINASKAMSAADKGTLLHKIMHHIDLLKTLNNQSFSEELKDLIRRKIIVEEDLKNIDIDKLYSLFATAMWRSIVGAATEVMKEKRISTVLKANVLGSVYDSEDIVVNCILDLVVRKGDKYYIFDYKTDTFNDGSDDEIQAHQALHRTQVTIYRDAMQACGYDVAGVYAIYTDIASIVPFTFS